MATDRPQRYAKQLAGHWSEKATVAVDRDSTTLVMEGGQTVILRAAQGCLEIEASVPEGGDLERWSRVVADHLQRFGQRDELTIVWT